MKIKLPALAFLLPALTACTITQNVKPVERMSGREVCIVNNPAVSQPGFLGTYQEVLARKGYTAKVIQVASPLDSCPITSTYTANWRWDLALYLAYADIKVYSNGQQIGQATYDALGGGGSFSKFIKAEEKIAELVEQLFPGMAKPAAQ